MLKKTIILSILLSFLLAPFSFSLKNINFTKAATIISSSEISEDTTWILDGSPYIITNDSGGMIIHIFPEAVLTIEPGVVVKLGSDSGFTVEGEMVANGTESNPVIFTSIMDDENGGDSTPNEDGLPQSGDWQAIYISHLEEGWK